MLGWIIFLMKGTEGGGAIPSFTPGLSMKMIAGAAAARSEC